MSFRVNGGLIATVDHVIVSYPSASAAAAAGAAAVPAPEPEPAGRSLPDLSSFWGRRRLLHQNTNLRSTQQQRLLLQLPLSTTLKPTGNQFKWPIPQVTGNRPPVGENGKPAGTAQPLRICDTKVFQFAMIFGPLMPAACGIFEVG